MRNANDCLSLSYMELRFGLFKLWFAWGHVKVVRVMIYNLKKIKGTKVQLIYRPGAGFVELDNNSSVAFVASSFTLESGEMAFRGDMCAP